MLLNNRFFVIFTNETQKYKIFNKIFIDRNNFKLFTNGNTKTLDLKKSLEIKTTFSRDI